MKYFTLFFFILLFLFAPFSLQAAEPKKDSSDTQKLGYQEVEAAKTSPNIRIYIGDQQKTPSSPGASPQMALEATLTPYEGTNPTDNDITPLSEILTIDEEEEKDPQAPLPKVSESAIQIGMLSVPDGEWELREPTPEEEMEHNKKISKYLNKEKRRVSKKEQRKSERELSNDPSLPESVKRRLFGPAPRHKLFKSSSFSRSKKSGKPVLRNTRSDNFFSSGNSRRNGGRMSPSLVPTPPPTLRGDSAGGRSPKTPRTPSITLGLSRTSIDSRNAPPLQLTYKTPVQMSSTMISAHMSQENQEVPELHSRYTGSQERLNVGGSPLSLCIKENSSQSDEFSSQDLVYSTRARRTEGFESEKKALQAMRRWRRCALFSSFLSGALGAWLCLKYTYLSCG